MSKSSACVGYWDMWNGTETLEKLHNSLYPRGMEKNTTKKEEILSFWNKHGLPATVDAFKVSRATLFRWRNQEGMGTLAPHSTAPHHRRSRCVHPALKAELIRLRELSPRLGKEKLRPLLAEYAVEQGLPVLSCSTVGRLIADLKQEGKIRTGRQLKLLGKSGNLVARERKKVKKLRRGSYMPQAAGDLVELDTVITYVDGKSRYTMTAIDVHSRTAFAWTYTSGSSRTGADFLSKVQTAFPFAIAHIQTDNGSEFLKDFHKKTETDQIPHFFNWVRYPKGQAHVERFNRTIQEEFLDWRKPTLAHDLNGFNQELLDWLIWYNCKRPHQSLKNLSPLAYLNFTKESQMYWTRT